MKRLILVICLWFYSLPLLYSNHLRKSKLRSRSNKAKQSNNYYTNIIGGNSNFETSNKNKFNSIAVTSSVASPFRVIPNAGEVFKSAISPEYVDQLNYYNDKPSQRDVEAISTGSENATFYAPFSHKRSISSVNLPAQNCNYYGSMIDCHTSGYCIWDKAIKVCVYREILIPVI